LVISSADCIQSVIPIHIKANALPIAEVSAFSSAAVLLIYHSHHFACAYPTKYLSGLSVSGVTIALNNSIWESEFSILSVLMLQLG
jgi:hypothetical protein